MSHDYAHPSRGEFCDFHTPEFFPAYLITMVSTSSLIIIASPLFFVQGATAWGKIAHKVIAQIADNFLLDYTRGWVSDILSDPEIAEPKLVNVANWADTWTKTMEGRHSMPEHYVQTRDSPPNSCSVYLEQDCGDRCLITAIVSTTLALMRKGASVGAKEEAMKLLVHYLGDVTQPLHVSGLGHGGHHLWFAWFGESRTLHELWDTGIPYLYVNTFFRGNYRRWAQYLTTQIRDPWGRYHPFIGLYLEGLDLSNLEECVIHWARDSNRLACEGIYWNLPGNGEPLSDEYIHYANQVTEEQLVKAGVRLAAWLNLLATGMTGF